MMATSVENRAEHLCLDRIEEERVKNPNKVWTIKEIAALQVECWQQAEEEWVDHCEQLKDSLENR